MSSQAPGIDASREPVYGSCPNCGESGLARYQVLAEGGWFEVVKCQSCLHTVERSRLDPLVLVKAPAGVLMSNRILAVDVGGTFTDVIAIVDGDVLTTKVPTTAATSRTRGSCRSRHPGRLGLQCGEHRRVNPEITRNLPKVGVFATEGHRDVLDGGHIGRPIEALADPGWRRGFGDSAAPLVPRYLRRGVTERLLANGDVLVPLDEDQAREQIRLLSRCHVVGVSICLINAYVDGAHERRLRELVHEELGDILCSISSEVSPLAKEYLPFTTTTLIDVVM